MRRRRWCRGCHSRRSAYSCRRGARPRSAEGRVCGVLVPLFARGEGKLLLSSEEGHRYSAVVKLPGSSNARSTLW